MEELKMKKAFLNAIFVFLIGYVLTMSVGGFFSDNKLNYGNSIIAGILYLSSVISVYMTLLINEVRSKK